MSKEAYTSVNTLRIIARSISPISSVLSQSQIKLKPSTAWLAQEHILQRTHVFLQRTRVFLQRTHSPESQIKLKPSTAWLAQEHILQRTHVFLQRTHSSQDKSSSMPATEHIIATLRPTPYTLHPTPYTRDLVGGNNLEGVDHGTSKPLPCQLDPIWSARCV